MWKTMFHHVLFAICIMLMVNGCGGDSPPTLSGGAEQPSPQVLMEITAQPVPEGVDAAVYAQLQAELIRVISETVSKETATPPTGELNAVTDLVLSGNDGDGWQLTWSYVNTGDYNLDGMVNVSDLTPVGQHYGAAAGDVTWGNAQSADGNGDGLVSVSDITPIGQNYEAFISGFNIYGAASPDGPWELIESLPRPDKPLEGSFQVSFNLAANTHSTYRVVPFDSSSIEGATGWPCAHLPVSAEVTIGTDTVVATQTIGAAGGSITAPGGSPIEGVSLTFPAGALPADTLVELGYNDGTVDLPAGQLGLPILEITVGDVYEFANPIQVSVPFDGELDEMPLACYISEDGRLDGMQAVEYDHVADFFIFETFHASKFTIVLVKQQKDKLLFHLGFNPLEDDFWVKNMATRYTDGNCLGMSMFAKWYFETVSHGSAPGLYGSYQGVVHSPPTVFNQALIATRAQLAVHRYHKDYAPAIIGRGYVASHQYNYNAVVNMLEITATPEVMILDAPGGQHAVLVIAVKLIPDTPNLIELWIYDPNRPGAKSIIIFDTTTETFQPYTSGANTYTKFIHFGTGTVRYGESFQDILTDADQGFHGGTDATIEILSHVDGAMVDTLLADFTGQVHSGQILIDRLTIRNGTAEIDAVLGPNGEFRVDLPIREGENFLAFHTQGYNEDNRLMTTHNNLLTSGFTLIGDFPPAEIAVTSHVNGQAVEDRNIVVAGSVIGGMQQVDRLVAVVDDQEEYSCSLDGSGSFSLPVSLGPGTNSFEFITQVQSGEDWEEVVNSNTPGEFILNGDFAASTAYAEVLWHSTKDLALNLYIIHPDDEYSGNGHYSDGSWGWHHYKNGIYSWWVDTESSGIIQWDGEYRVRLQFYHSHIIVDPPGEDLAYTVRIRLHEGTPNEISYVHSGVAPFEPFHHPTADPDYWDPFTVRAGWTDVCTFIPTMP